MKAKVVTLRTEGFPSAYCLQFEIGLPLYSDNLLWGGKEKRDRIRAKFLELVEYMIFCGFDIDIPEDF